MGKGGRGQDGWERMHKMVQKGGVNRCTEGMCDMDYGKVGRERAYMPRKWNEQA